MLPTSITVDASNVSGTLSYPNATPAITLNVNNDVTVNSGGTFKCGTQTNTVAHLLNVGGNITNNGTFTPITTAGTKVVDITLNGTAVQTMSTTVAATLNNLTINPGSRLTTSGTIAATTLNINSAIDGSTGTLVDNGILTATTTNVQQFLTGGRNWYVSSPVNGATTTTGSGVLATSTATTKPDSFVWYDETKGSGTPTSPWTPVTTGALIAGKGYVATNPTGTPSTDGIITFTGGTLNNGNVTANFSRTTGQTSEGFNLIGNPYPSHVTMTYPILNNADLLNTIWYRTATYDAPNTKFVYSFNTYQINSDGSSVASPVGTTGIISPMQAFWVRKNAAVSGSLTFTNTMRSHQSSNPLKVRAVNAVTMPLLRLELGNGSAVADETVIYLNPNASNAFDGYDSPKMSVSNATASGIYTSIGTEKLVINGMNSIASNQEIPLGFTPGSATTFSIKASEVTNFETGTQIFLKDNALGSITEITDGTPYAFAPDNTVAPDQRFALLFKLPSITTGVNPADGGYGDNTDVIVTRNANNRISVNCVGGLTGESSVAVYNAVGKKLVSRQLSRSITVLDQLEAGAYVVIVKNGGKAVTKKVILN